MANAAVFGAGSWGTALASLLTVNHENVFLWGRSQDETAKMQLERCNTVYLPGFTFPKNLTVTSDTQYALSDVSVIVLATPSHAMRDILPLMKPIINSIKAIVCAVKGFDNKTGQLLHHVFNDQYPGAPYAVLSGPSFAKEVVKGLPTAVTVAAESLILAKWVQAQFHSEYFRVYSSDDIVGVEVGGAVKNVLAIAAGISDGLGFAINARAALITRGIAEMQRLNSALGGKPGTLMGLAGLGDLVLTCSDDQSRNRRFGLALGQGKSIEAAKHTIKQTIEGINTAKHVNMLAKQYRVDMPICEQVYHVIFNGVSPKEAVENLLLRAATEE